MKNKFDTILRLEEALLFGLSIYWFALLNISWWWFLGLLFLPDISMLGYLSNQKLGALIYNIGHNRILALAVYFIGIYFCAMPIKLIGIMLFAHIAMDRMLNFGLKYDEDFKLTHLGIIDF